MTELYDGQSLLAVDAAAQRMGASNRAYQAELVALMARLDAAQKRTVQLKVLNRQLLPSLECGPQLKIEAPQFEQPTLPWFKHYHNQDLPPNEDGQAREAYQAAVKHLPWAASERQKLRKEVINQNHAKLTRDAQRQNANVGQTLHSVNDNFYVESTEDLDWDKIALAIDRRNAIECRIQWLSHDHPLINKSKWSKAELRRLGEITEKREAKDWKAIAAELGTGRTPVDCVRQFRMFVRTQTIKWTAEMDKKLLDLVKAYGQNWQVVARALGPGFSSNQCIERWARSVKPAIRKGPWGDNEDALLRAAVESVAPGPNFWPRVAERIGNGRPYSSCRERWANVLNPKLLPFNTWSVEEDDLLRELKEEKQLGWAEIAGNFNGTRTDNHCMKRYKLLTGKPILLERNNKRATNPQPKRPKLDPAKPKPPTKPKRKEPKPRGRPKGWVPSQPKPEPTPPPPPAAPAREVDPSWRRTGREAKPKIRWPGDP